MLALPNFRTEDPFFLYVAFGHVHVPLGTDARFQNASGVGPFQDTLLEMDDTVGKIVAALEQRGLQDDTLIWFASKRQVSFFL
jgi:arylsulfatase A-like enzyme